MKKTLVSLLLTGLFVSQLSACSTKAPAPAPKDNEIVSEAVSETPSVAESEAPSVAESEAPSVAESEAPSEEDTPAVTEEESEAPSVSVDTSDDLYVGNWYERYAQRGYMTVTKEDDVYCFQVNWADSADANYCWTFSAPQNEAGVIAYSNCKKVLITWDADGNDSEEVIEENAIGSVYINENGNLMWDEHNDMPEANEFIKE